MAEVWLLVWIGDGYDYIVQSAHTNEQGAWDACPKTAKRDKPKRAYMIDGPVPCNP